MIRAFIPPLVIAVMTSSLTPVLAKDSNVREPEAVVADVIRLDGKRLIPSWAEPQFGLKMRRYLTPELINAVSHGSKVAREKGINLFDGDFLTGAQGAVRVVQFDSKAIGSTGSKTIVLTHIGISDTTTRPNSPGAYYAYTLRRIDGKWLIDDIAEGSSQGALAEPSRKELFSDPVRYRRQ